ncbi:hypothetical protein NG800_018090 [Epilithonimonas ginsengisoli]|uniref:DUF4595 domain-containing protein n=1 Tax=Epilithonimonas ginsengisoli TaxID=1245592 RepID=A0ABU4JMD8_9FLAO|nr:MULTISPECIES: hypothetical protein [Chryseobacterium group]MBV6881787.1 hypothetical protein [Epilithonimonas sp. FP105]MDW8550843.1 hypothetical protein [Epilithonimonas ginsengisoli]OAH68517.1 hypothetical protein AXA65_17060 [Chryseobacterium sp. FP211-J200]
MKNLIYLLLSFTALSCNGQNNKNPNMLDIEYLRKNGASSSISYNGAISTSDNSGSAVKHYHLTETKNDEKIITEGDEETGFIRTVESTDYVKITEYDGKGLPLTMLKKSVYGFEISKSEYKNDKIITEVDFDKLFDFNDEKLFTYMKNNGFALDKKQYLEITNSEVPRPQILRGFAEDFKFLIPELKLRKELVWILVDVPGNYNGQEGIYFVCLSGTDGKELRVKKYIGKKSGKNGIGTYPNYQILKP